MTKLRRLIAMSPHEIFFRSRERMRMETDRRVQRSVVPPLSLVKFAARFYISSAERQTLPSFIRQYHPEWVDRSIKEVQTLLDQSNMDWHRDPVTAVEWPRLFWADY